MSDIPISHLPPATSVGSTDIFPIVQGGITKKAEASLIGSLLSTNVARVDPNGDDATGTVGNSEKPFKTVQAAATKFEGLSPGSDDCVFSINGSFTEDVTTSLQSLVFEGNGTFDTQPFASLTLTDPTDVVRVFGVNCSLSNISANTTNTLNVDVSSGGSLQGTVQNSGGNVLINGSGPSVGSFNIDITAAGQVAIGNLWGWTSNINITCGTDISSYDCLLNNVTAGGDVYMYDSRFKPGGTLAITGTVTYNDAFLADVGAFANTARVDPSGNDSTGQVGDISKPFKTCQAALTALETQGGFTQNSPAVVILPVVDTVENVTTSLRFLVLQGPSITSDGSNPAIGQVTLTNDGSNSGVLLGLSNVWTNGVFANNILNNGSLTVYLNAATVTGDITSSASLLVSATYNTGAVYGTITCGNGTGMSVRGLIGSYQNELFPTLNAVNSPLIVYLSLIYTIQAATSIDLYDSRVNTNSSGVTPAYHDALLANPIFPDADPHIAGAGYWVAGVLTKSAG